MFFFGIIDGVLKNHADLRWVLILYSGFWKRRAGFEQHSLRSIEVGRTLKIIGGISEIIGGISEIIGCISENTDGISEIIGCISENIGGRFETAQPTPFIFSLLRLQSKIFGGRTPCVLNRSADMK